MQRRVAGITELVAQKVEDVDLALRGAGAGRRAVHRHVARRAHRRRRGLALGRVLPRLRPGVHVHIHDVFLPGDYPEQWVHEGWGWNENYLVEAVLQFKTGYDILLAAQWALLNARKETDLAFPLFAHSEEKGGAALGLRRT